MTLPNKPSSINANADRDDNSNQHFLTALEKCRPIIGDDPIDRVIFDISAVTESLEDMCDPEECLTEDAKAVVTDTLLNLERITGELNPLAGWTWVDVARELDGAVTCQEDLKGGLPGRRNFNIREHINNYVKFSENPGWEDITLKCYEAMAVTRVFRSMGIGP